MCVLSYCFSESCWNNHEYLFSEPDPYCYSSDIPANTLQFFWIFPDTVKIRRERKEIGNGGVGIKTKNAKPVDY